MKRILCVFAFVSLLLGSNVTFASLYLEGYVQPNENFTPSTDVTIGHWENGWGKVRINAATVWHVQDITVHTNSVLEVKMANTKLLANDINLYHGQMTVESGAVVSNATIRVGDSSSVDLPRKSTLTINNARVRPTNQSDLSYGSIIVSNGGQFEAPLRVEGFYLFQTNNLVRVQGEDSALTGALDVSGGSVEILEGGSVTAGGSLSGPYAANTNRIVRALVSGTNSVWGASEATHTIRPGAELRVEDGGRLESRTLRVGVANASMHPPGDDGNHRASLVIAGAGSRLDASKAYESSDPLLANYGIKIGIGDGHDDEARGLLHVRDGAEAHIRGYNLSVAPQGIFRASGPGTLVTNAPAVFIFNDGHFEIQDEAQLLNGQYYQRESTSTGIFSTGSVVRVTGLYIERGELTSTAAEIETGWLHLGKDSPGKLSVRGGELTVTNAMRIGANNCGILTVEGGAVFSSETNQIGHASVDTGTVTVRNTNTIWTTSSPVYVGDAGIGRLRVQDQAQASMGAVMLGKNGEGELVVSNGVLMVNGALNAAHEVGTATLKIEGPDARLEILDALVAGSTNGDFTLTVQNGGYLICKSSEFSGSTGTVHEVLIEGIGSRWESHEFIRLYGASLLVRDGAFIETGDLDVFNLCAEGNSSFRMEGGTGIFTNSLYSNARFELSDGAHLTGGGESSTFVFGTDDSLAYIHGNGTVFTNAGIVSVESHLDELRMFELADGARLYATTVHVGPEWGGAGDMRLVGSNTVLNTTNCFVGSGTGEGEWEGEGEGEWGGPWVTNRLFMADSAELKAETVTIGQTGWLEGDGTIRGAVTNHGVVAPGEGSRPGKIIFSNGFVQSAQGTLCMTILGAGATQHDEIQTSGDVELDGILRVNLHGWRPSGTNDIRIIISKGTVSGTFAAIELNAPEYVTAEYDYEGGFLRVVGEYNDQVPYTWLDAFSYARDVDVNEEKAANQVNTLKEAYLAGLDPKDENARFVLSSFNKVNDGYELAWNAVSGRVYQVYWSTNLMSGFERIGTHIKDGTFTNLQSSASQGYYRLRVELDP